MTMGNDFAGIFNQHLNIGSRTIDCNLANRFNKFRSIVNEWIKAAKDAGIKFAILTVTHETGFALYLNIQAVNEFLHDEVIIIIYSHMYNFTKRIVYVGRRRQSPL